MPSDHPHLTDDELAALEERIAYSLRTGLGLPATIDEFQRLIAEVRRSRETAKPKQRGVDFPCEGCGALKGSTLDDGWWRCSTCAYPSP
jgi:hypothetical protein